MSGEGEATLYERYRPLIDEWDRDGEPELRALARAIKDRGGE